MIAVITKETDALARQAIREELALLNPMLSGGLDLGGGGAAGWDLAGSPTAEVGGEE